MYIDRCCYFLCGRVCSFLSIGFSFGILLYYFLTIYWTFRVRPSKRNVAGLVGAHLFNLFVVRMGLMWLFIHVIGLAENVAYLPTLFISVILNFILIKWIIGKI